MNCDLCGKAVKKLAYCWYQYDNGEQFRASVCKQCKEIHSTLIGKAK